MNLTTVVATLSDDGYVFDEGALVAAADDDEDPPGARPWDTMTHSWRGWFALETLAGLSGILRARRDGQSITVEAQAEFQLHPAGDRLDMARSAALALGDDAGYSLASIVQDASREPCMDEMEDVEARLDAEGIDLRLAPMVSWLRWYQASHERMDASFEPLLAEAFRRALAHGPVVGAAPDVYACVLHAVAHGPLSAEGRHALRRAVGQLRTDHVIQDYMERPSMDARALHALAARLHPPSGVGALTVQSARPRDPARLSSVAPTARQAWLRSLAVWDRGPRDGPWAVSSFAATKLVSGLVGVGWSGRRIQAARRLALKLDKATPADPTPADVVEVLDVLRETAAASRIRLHLGADAAHAWLALAQELHATVLLRAQGADMLDRATEGIHGPEDIAPDFSLQWLFLVDVAGASDQVAERGWDMVVAATGHPDFWSRADSVVQALVVAQRAGADGLLTQFGEKFRASISAAFAADALTVRSVRQLQELGWLSGESGDLRLIDRAPSDTPRSRRRVLRRRL